MNLLPKGDMLTSSNELVSTWISIGRFDAIQTYRLDIDNQNLFEAIQKNGQRVWNCCNTEIYTHALVLISTKPLGSDESFWRNQSWFLSVSRIHFKDSIASADTFSQIENGIDLEANKLGVPHCFYRTEALSDMVLVCKANRFDQILKLTLSLQQLSDVGKIYTHYGVNYDCLKLDLPHFIDAWSLLSADDQIPLFSMRFAIEGFEGVSDQLNNLGKILGQESAYSIAGVDDIIITWENMLIRNLIRLYRDWFLPVSVTTYNCAAGITSLPLSCHFQGDVFHGITTRLGIPYVSQNAPNEEVPVNSVYLIRKCDGLLNLIKKIDPSCTACNEWLRPLTVLTQTMMRISQTVILDEFVYVMLPAVEAFLKNVVAYQQTVSKTNVEIYHNFIGNWMQLMEYVMREEDQLTHHPDVRPVLFDFSVAMLEYTLAFLDLLTKVLQSVDCAIQGNGFDGSKIRMLLVPQLCSRIEAQELFAANQSKGLPGLILVTIPVSDLYRPHEIQRALCHEVSHFVGEKSRSRKVRTVYYFQAVAILIAKVIFKNYDLDIVKTVYNYLYRCFRFSQQTHTIRNMQRFVIIHLNKLMDPNCIFPPNAANLSSFQSFDLSSVEQFKLLLGDISILFREIYADICMLYILPESETIEYIKNIFEELVNGESDDQRRRYEQFAIRIHVSLKALNRENKTTFVRSLEPHNISDKLYTELDNLNYTGSQESTSRLIPLSAINRLQQYADICSKCLYSNLGQGKYTEELEKVQNMFSDVASTDLDYERFLQYISEYRRTVLRTNE